MVKSYLLLITEEERSASGTAYGRGASNPDAGGGDTPQRRRSAPRPDAGGARRAPTPEVCAQATRVRRFQSSQIFPKMLGVSIGDDVVQRPSSKVVSPGHLKSNLGETVGHDLCPKSSQDFPCLNFAGGLQGVISPGQIKLVEDFAAFCKRMRAMSREKSTEYQSNQSNVHSTEVKKKLVHSFGHCLNGKTIDGLCGVFISPPMGIAIRALHLLLILSFLLLVSFAIPFTNEVDEKSNKTGGCTYKPTTDTLAHDFDEPKDGAKEFFQSANANLDASIANFHTPITGQGLSKISSVVKTQSAPVLPIMKKWVSFAEADKFKSGP